MCMRARQRPLRDTDSSNAADLTWHKEVLSRVLLLFFWRSDDVAWAIVRLKACVNWVPTAGRVKSCGFCRVLRVSNGDALAKAQVDK